MGVGGGFATCERSGSNSANIIVITDKHFLGVQHTV